MSTSSAPLPAPIGLLPAAGRGLRFGTAAYAKELFPLLFSEEFGEQLAPRPICELSLAAIARAGAARCVVVISPEKTELVRALGAGSSRALDLGYVVQPEPLGLPHAIRCARAWLGNSDVVMAMPDTVILPPEALQVVQALRVKRQADLALGVFPVDEPERLGPVEMDEDGTVSRIYDKPGHRRIMNSWGVASWSARFTDFVCAFEAEREKSGVERVLGHAFEAARQAGMPVVAAQFANGHMLDIGTPKGLRAALRALAERGIIESLLAPR